MDRLRLRSFDMEYAHVAQGMRMAVYLTPRHLVAGASVSYLTLALFLSVFP